jgi:predicted outer membrane repeat protein
MFRHGLSSLKTRARITPGGERKRHRQRHRAPEGLEDRVLLSGSPTVYTVDLTSASTAGSGTAGDLRYCIVEANANTNSAGSEIEFDPSVFSTATPRVITLSSTLELSETAGPEVIDGPGPGVVTISGNNQVKPFAVGYHVTASLSGVTISGGQNNDGSGGGIANGGTLTVSNCLIEMNSAQFGGGIYNNGTLTVTGNTTIQNNTSANIEPGSDGGGIFNDGATVTVTNATIQNNSAEFGGGIDNDNGGALAVTNATIENNLAKLGGGILNRATSTATIAGSTVSGNTASGTSANAGGGGVYSSGTASITASTVSGNSATQSGGGIYASGGALTITNSTVVNNSLSGGTSSLGAGVDENGATLSVVNCTIAHNTEPMGDSGNGGGIWAAYGTATLNNTIIALNTDGTGPSANPDNLYGYAATVSAASAHNLIGTGGSGGLMNGTNGNQVGVAIPGLAAALADNGGPTQTIALLAGSPAIGTGSAALAVDSQGHPLATDQRGAGFARVVNGHVDIGAFQFQSPVVSMISPAQVEAGFASPITLTVTGSDFMSQSVVDWNSAPLATIYVSSTELTATVPASDLASAGKNTITVTNPAIDGGTSGGVTFQVVNSPTPTPKPTPELILGVEPVFRRKTNRKGKPVGKPVVTGFLLDFSAPLDPAAASNPANYQIDLVTTKKVRKTVKRFLHPLPNFAVSYTPSELAADLNLGSAQTFPTGGRITVLAGVTSGSGTVLEGTTEFTISKGGKSVEPE